MKRKYWIILIFTVSLSCVVYLKFKNTIDLSEKLPIKITQDNIVYGKIRAYHPDIFYMKYQLKFATNYDIVEDNASDEDTLRIKEYFYYIKNNSNVTNAENTILKNDSAQSYLKIISHDGTNYIFTVSGDHPGSADYRDLFIKLYRLENNKYELIFDKIETYSTDPGIESNFFTERFKLLIYRKLKLDNRY